MSYTTQTSKILNLLKDGAWHCTSEMYAMFMSDPRRRIVDLKEKGYELEGKKCELHDYHKGCSKMWRLGGGVKYRVFTLPDGTVIGRAAVYQA